MNAMSFILATATTSNTGSGTPPQETSVWMQLAGFLPLILIVVAMYFLMIRPQRKQQKKEQEMRNNIRVGDEITTIGGIRGRVVKVSEEDLVIETGADRNKMTMMKWAVQSNDTVHEKDAVDDDDDDDDDDD